MVSMWKDLFHNSQHNSCSHFITFFFERLEHFSEVMHELFRIDDAKGCEVVGVFGFLENIGKIIFSWTF